MRRTTCRSRAFPRQAVAAAFVVVLAAGTACGSGVAPGIGSSELVAPSARMSVPSGGMSTSLPTGTPNLSPSVPADVARRANAIAFEWVESIGGLPRPEVVWDAPADPSEMVAIKLRFPHQVTLPAGIPMVKSLGEEGSRGSVVVTTTEPKSGTTALVVVDLVARRLHAVAYIGPFQGSPP